MAFGDPQFSIIIITHLLHENKSEVLTIEIEMADMQMEQARQYKQYIQAGRKKSCKDCRRN